MQEIVISREELRKLYEDYLLSLREISSHYRIDLKTTIKLFNKNGIERRSIIDSWQIRRPRIISDKELEKIANEYYEGKLGFNRLARKYGLRRQTLSKHLKRFGIVVAHRGIYLRGRKKTEDHRKHISEGRTRMLVSSPRLIEKLREHRLKQKLPLKDTLIERLVCEGLARREIGHYSQYSILGACQADKAFPDCKLAVFCDGDYWHRRDDIARKDERINKLLRNNGWTVLRFWETDIKQNPEQIIDTIENELKNLRGGIYGIKAPKME